MPACTTGCSGRDADPSGLVTARAPRLSRGRATRAPRPASSAGTGCSLRDLAAGNARVLSGLGEAILNDPDVEPDKRKVTGNLFDAVWNDVFDAGPTVWNATRPEHLFSYISAAYPGLFNRMLWPQ